MPMPGGTRMLRARRKDCNVKPNRRLDRKSSRGMLYENEELRMRTITINAEVEQGQHALKKLRRENEQLRREMWSLRDEYDKMEKLLRKKETDDDSNRENSDSEGSQTDESSNDDDQNEKPVIDETAGQQGEQFEEENQLKALEDHESNARTFDGLSVIDEQTEETQTTESPLGGGTSSRGTSEVNTATSLPLQLYDEACGLPEYPSYVGGYATPGKPLAKRKSSFENGHYTGNWATSVCDTYETRPASPYPYNGSLQDSYRKRFQVLQNLSSMTPAAPIPDNEWILPDSSKSTDLPGYELFVGTSFADEKGSGTPCPALPPPDFPFDIIQDRTGPDVFVTDGFPQTDPSSKESSHGVMNTLEAKLDGVKIGRKAERDPKRGDGAKGGGESGGGSSGGGGGGESTTLTKSPVSRDGSAKIAWDPQETPQPAKLTIDESPGENDNSEFPSRVQPLVPCQNPFGQDVRDPLAPETEPKSPPPDEMPHSGSGSGGPGGGGSKFQTKLTVTLKTPTKVDAKRAFGPTTPALPPPRAFHQTPFRYGVKPEYATMRFQTFPSSGGHPAQGPGAHAVDGTRDHCLVNHYAGVRTHANGLSGSLPRLPGLLPKPEIGLNASHIPVNDLETELDVCPDQESLPPMIPAAQPQPFLKPVKIPPVPPPRTSSCPKPIIPGFQVQGGNHPRVYRQTGKPIHMTGPADGKPMDPMIYNPLLLSQPIATSSPTISLRATKYGPNSSTENLYLSRFQRQNYYDESSNEDLTKQKSRFRDEMTAVAAAAVAAGGVGGTKLNKSLSSPSFDTFRTVRRKPQADDLTTSVENILSQRILAEGISAVVEKSEKKPSTKVHGQSNVSVSSSSGLDSPVKSDRRKRRVSIQFKKKQFQDGKRTAGEEEKESTCSRRNSLNQQSLPSTSRGTHGSAIRKLKGKPEETDATTSERERTNSISSRTSSLATGSGSRRKFSTSSNRTFLNDEKIPWCGCWGNGCI